MHFCNGANFVDRKEANFGGGGGKVSLQLLSSMKVSCVHTRLPLSILALTDTITNSFDNEIHLVIVYMRGQLKSLLV